MLLDYYNENSHRSYPLYNPSTVPTDIIVGCSISTTYPAAEPAYYLSKITVGSTVMSVEFSRGSSVVMTGSSPITTGSPSHYPVKLTSFDPRLQGFFVAGPCATSGTWTFDSTSGRLDNSVIHRSPEVQYTTLEGLSGIVGLTSGDDLVFDVVGEQADGTKVVRVYLQDAALRKYASECDAKYSSNACGRPVVQRINGVTPDANGRVFVELRNAK